MKRSTVSAAWTQSVATCRRIGAGIDPRWWLAVLFCLALALRLWGIDWGLPGRMELHPDEHDYVLRNALRLSTSRLDPGFLNYPAFLMYLIAGTFRGLTQVGWISGEVWQAFLIGRLWSAFFAAATVFPVYKMARELGGSARAALLASLWMSLLPLSVWEAHIAITDPLMTFWTAMTLWGAVRLVRTSRLYDYLFAGVCLGLATGSKYTAAMAVVAIVAGALVAFHRRGSWAETLAGLSVAGMISVLCAYFVTPYSFIRFEALLTALASESNHIASHHPGFSLPADGWQYRRYLYQLVAAWPFSFGIALYGSVIAGTLWALWKFDGRRFPLIAFGAVFFGVTGSWTFVPLRYYFPLLVIGVLFAGLWHGALLDAPRRSVRMAGGALVAATFAYTVLFTVQTTARFTHDTRIDAGKWLEKNLRHGEILAACGWSRYIALPDERSGCVLVGGKDDGLVEQLADNAPYDLIETTSLHYDRHVRHGATNPLAAYRRLRSAEGPFTRVATFEAKFIHKAFYQKLDPMFGGYFISPTIEFFHVKQRVVETRTASARSP